MGGGFAASSETRAHARKEHVMLYWAAVFFVIAIIAAFFGFGGIAAGAAGLAKVLFFLFLILFVLSLLTGLFRGSGSPRI